MTMEMPGIPIKIPPQTWTQCLAKKNCVPQEDKDCKIIKNEFKGDTFEGVVKAKHGGDEITQILRGNRLSSVGKKLVVGA